MAEAKNPLGETGRTVAVNVKRLRQGRGLTYVELEQRLDEVGRRIPVLGLAGIEKERRRVDADDLVALAVVLGVTPTTLLLPVDGSDDAEEATATGEVTGADLWAWAERWAPLPSQRPEPPEVLEAPTGVARGRAVYETDPRTAAMRWRVAAGPGGVDPSDHEFLAGLYEALRRRPEVGLRVWSDHGHLLSEYPVPAATYRHHDEPIDRDGQRWEELREHLVAILTSDAVAPLLPSILERVEQRKR